MHVTLLLNALLKGERRSFGQVMNFHVLIGLNRSLLRATLSTWPFPVCQLQNIQDCCCSQVTLLYAGAQCKQVTKGRFINPLVSFLPFCR